MRSTASVGGKGKVIVKRNVAHPGTVQFKNSRPPGPHAGQVYQTGVGWMQAKSKLRPFAKSTPSKPSGKGGGPSVADRQRALRAKGYHVAVDGVIGPETRSAIRAAKNGMGAGRWNHSYHGISSGSSGGSGAGSTPGVPRTAGGGPTRRGGGGGGGMGGGGRGGGGAGGGAAGGKSQGLRGEAHQYALSLIAQQYGPQVAELAAQLGKSKGQTDANVADLASWYAQVGGKAQDAAGAVHQQGQQAVDEFGTMAGNLAQAFGMGDPGQQTVAEDGTVIGGHDAQPGGYQTGAAAQIMAGALQQQAAENDSFNQDMLPILATQGTEARQDEQRYGNQQAEDIMRAQRELAAQKGSALTAAEFNAMGALTQRQAAQQNMRMAAQMAGLDVAGKRLDLAGKRAGLQSQRLQLQADKLTIQEMHKQTRGGKSFKWKEVDVPGVTDRLTNIISDKRGTLTVDPRRALAALQNEMSAMFGKRGRNDPRAVRIMENALSRMFSRSKQANTRAVQGWKWTNGRLIDPSGHVIYTFTQIGSHHQ